MIHGTETECNSKMAIELDGSKFGTNNGTADLIEMSRGLNHREVSSSFRSLNLVNRVGHEFLKPSHPPGSTIHRPKYPGYVQVLTPS